MNSRFSLTKARLKRASEQTPEKPKKKCASAKPVEKKQQVVPTAELSRNVPPPPPEEPKSYAKYEGKEPRLGTVTIKQIAKANEELPESKDLVATYEELANEYAALLEQRDQLKSECADLEKSITEAKRK